MNPTPVQVRRITRPQGLGQVAPIAFAGTRFIAQINPDQLVGAGLTVADICALASAMMTAGAWGKNRPTNAADVAAVFGVGIASVAICYSRTVPGAVLGPVAAGLFWWAIPRNGSARRKCEPMPPKPV